MAGPPRSSHTKSRNGCQTCKRRHIRCDETSPRCRNCAKSNRECGYMDKQATRDAPIPTATAAAPPKDITPEIDAVIEQRRTTGTSPCSERLLGHIEHLSDNLHRRGLGETTVWSAHMPRLLIIARSTHFVMSSILALSAFHIAYVTGSQEALSLSHYHRNIAAVGLQVAIGSLSKENCDAILAASLVLSWQAADWAALSTLQKGILSVLDSMQLSCKETSEIARILESQIPSRTRACTTSYRTSGTLQLGNLDSAIADFHRSQERLQHIPELYHTLTELIDLVKQVRSDVPFQVPFSRLQSLQTWILWLPTKLLRGGEGDLGALAVLAHFYSAALVLEPFFAGLEGSYLGCMNLSLIETTDVILHTLQSRFPTAHIAQLAISLMDAPRRTVNDYRTTIQWTPHVPNHSMNCMMPTPSLYRQCDEYPRSSSVTSSPHTPTTISGFGHAVTSPPPFEHSHSYKYGGNFSSLHMSSTAAPRSDYYDDWLSDYSQPGMIEHWAAFSSYCNEYLHGSPTEVGDSVHPGLVHGYSVSDPPGLWT